jgi:hypothetical protein
MVTIPPEVVRMRASSTVLVKASNRVNRDLAGMVGRNRKLRSRSNQDLSKGRGNVKYGNQKLKNKEDEKN